MLPSVFLLPSSGGDNLSKYIAYVNSIPLLQEEEERQLLLEFTQHGNQAAGKKVAEAHLRIVVKIAMQFRNYTNNLWDAIAEGNIGLLKALRNFSLEKNVKFVTYATLWVKASVQEFILKSSSNLKISIGQMQKKILFNLHKVKKSIAQYSTKSSNAEVSRILQVPESEVEALQNATYNTSLNSPIQAEEKITIEEVTPSSTPTPEETFFENKNKEECTNFITKAFQSLNERERFIVTKRFLAQKQLTLLELSKHFNISVERVRQIQENALKKMKTHATQSI